MSETGSKKRQRDAEAPDKGKKGPARKRLNRGATDQDGDGCSDKGKKRSREEGPDVEGALGAGKKLKTDGSGVDGQSEVGDNGSEDPGTI